MHTTKDSRVVLACSVSALLGCAGCAFFDPTGLDSATADGTGETTEGVSGLPTTSGGPNDARVVCTEAPYDLSSGIVGVEYKATVAVEGGAPPFQWNAVNLPPGLTITPNEPDGRTAAIAGIPEAVGSFPVEFEVIDGEQSSINGACNSIAVFEPLRLDTDALLDEFPDGCITGDGVAFTDLMTLGILSGGDGSEPTCSLIPGRGNGSRDLDDDPDTEATFPPGVSLDPKTCVVSSELDPKLRFGTYAWIVTFEQSGVAVHVPYCAMQSLPPVTAYEIVRTDSGTDSTLAPGHLLLGAVDSMFTFGSDAPDPQVRVTYNQPCAGACYWAYIFSYNALSPVAKVQASPSSKFPANGFEGFSHAIRIEETDTTFLDEYRRRAFVVNVTFDYCIAQNEQDCGNDDPNPVTKAEKIRTNGAGSAYEFALVVLPEEL